MTKILFVCHGNICRSPNAEFYMKELVLKAGLQDEFEIASAATHREELGNPVYPPTKALLKKHGIDCSCKRARLMLKEDYNKFDLLIGMDEENLIHMERICGGDPEKKLHNLLEYAGRPGDSVADPWYTRDFERTWQDVAAGCQGLLEACCGISSMDFSACKQRDDFYKVMRAKAKWPDTMGDNLDALFQILLSPQQRSARYLLLMPENPSDDVRDYAEKVFEVFDTAGKAIV